MELRQLASVVAIAHHRNFTRAANALHIAQPALSAQVQKLEQELHVLLFERTTRHVNVTPAGAALVRYARRILGEVEAASRDMAAYSTGVRGVVRIGAWLSTNPSLPTLFAEFVREHPDVRIEIREEYSDSMLDLVRQGMLDVALVTLWHGLDLQNIEHEVYINEPFVLGVSSASEFANRNAVTIPEIAHLPLIMHKPGSTLRRLVDDAFAGVGRTPRVAVETNQTSFVPQLVAAEIGAAILPRSAATEVGAAITWIGFTESMRRSAALAWARGRSTPATAAFVSYARRYLAARAPLHKKTSEDPAPRKVRKRPR